MQDSQKLDQTFQFIMETFVDRGDAPHYTEIAATFGITPDEGKRLLHDLINTGIMPMWLHPGTDVIASFAPFNNLPTQYRITVEGRQKWFGQGGFESLAVCWAFPGKPVQIDAPCLDCGEPMRIVVRDGKIESQSPSGIVGYVDIPLREWATDWSFSGGRMNLFRSEEHVKNWSGFKQGTDEAMLSVFDLMAIFQTPRHRAKYSGNYVSCAPEYAPAFFDKLKEVTGGASFWDPSNGSLSRLTIPTGGETMLPEKQSQAYDAFSASVRENDILGPKTTCLIYLAVAMAVGCYPGMNHCLSDAKENQISDAEIGAAQAIVMAVSAGRVNAQFKDATGQ